MRCLTGWLAAGFAWLAAQQQPASPPAAPEVHYDLSKPSRAFDLPPKLREVSAVTAADDHTVACLQDEKGVLFFVDTRDGQVLAAQTFGPDGDYEGLARRGSNYYVLRSDGWLARLAPQDGGLVVAEAFDLGLPNRDLEGLCFDEARGALLVVPKDVVKGEKPKGKRGETARDLAKQQREQRLVFAWDPKRHALLDKPVLRLSLEDLVKQAQARGDDLPMRDGKKGEARPALALRFSDIAVHPSTGHLYLLSAVDRVLVVVDRQGQLQKLHRLDAEVLPQPEGLTFLPDGSLVLTSEGVNGPARLLVYPPSR